MAIVMAGKRKSTIRDQEKQAKRQASIRKGFAEAAELLGLTHLLEQFPHRLRQRLWNLPVGEPVVQADPSSVSHPSAAVIRTELQQHLRHASIALDGKRAYPVASVITFVAGLQLLLRWMQAPAEGALANRLAAEGFPVVEEFFKRYLSEALLNLIAEVRAGIAQHQRLDRQLITFSLCWQEMADGKLRTAIIFAVNQPQRIEVEVEGDRRTAFRCGGQFAVEPSIQWVAWPGSALGIEDSKMELPVYVQKHALHRLEERLREIGPAAAHFWLWSSLSEPTLVAKDGDHYTIEYRFLQWRLGYLMGRRVGDRVVITTFIFLTMQGSPEAELLRQTLRLQRRDIEYQGLDELRTFVGTDMLDDPVLQEIFRQCGCGHLAELRSMVVQRPAEYAAQLRKYLRLDDEKQLQALSRRLGRVLPTEDQPPALAA